MGKTRLVTHLADVAREDGLRVVAGHCWETVDAPALWPWMQVLDQLDTSLDESTDALPTATISHVRQQVHDLSSASTDASLDTRLSIAQSITSVLSRNAEGTPLLVVLEDLHAADETTLLVLRYAATTLRAVPVLVVATFDEMAIAAQNGRSRVLREMSRDGTRIDLRPLDRGAIEQICHRMMGSSASDATIDALVRSTQGNPLFVEESIRLLLAEGDLNRPDHSVGFRVPRGVRDVLSARLASLPTPTYEILSVAAVIGRRFDCATLAQVTNLEPDDALELLEPALEMKLLDEAGALGEFRFRHVLIRETLYEELAVSRRMKLHREVAQALEDMHATDEGYLNHLAHHWFKAAQAGDPRKTVDYTIRAGDRAAATGAVEEAARLYQRAIKLLETLPGERTSKKVTETKLRALRDAREPPVNAPPPEGNLFRLEGEYWTIRFTGDVVRLKDSKGLRLIATLLSNPGRELHALDLVTMDGTRPRSTQRNEGLAVDPSTSAPVLDATAKQQIRQRIEELEDDIEDSERFNDPVRAQRARAELDELRRSVASALGLGGRDRKLGSEAEKARVSVTKTIREALKKIERADPELGSHLAATLKTGIFCSYSPDPRVPIEWTT